MAIMTYGQLVTKEEKCFAGNFKTIIRTVNGIQLKLVLLRVSPQSIELYGYIKDYFKDDRFFKLGRVIGSTYAVLHR